jgi:hypothetical protein
MERERGDEEERTMSRRRRSSGRGRSGRPAGRRRTGGCRRSATAPSTRSRWPRRRLYGVSGPRSHSGPDCCSPPCLVYFSLSPFRPVGDRTREDLIFFFFFEWSQRGLVDRTAGGWRPGAAALSSSASAILIGPLMGFETEFKQAHT